MRILVLDDQQAVREVLVDVVRAFANEAGLVLELGEGSSLAEGRRLLAQPWDLLITDLSLGDGKSLDMIAEVRARDDAHHAELPVILISGFLSKDRMQQAEQLGIRHILPKPFLPQSLIGILHQLLSSGLRAAPANAERHDHSDLHSRVLPRLFEMDRQLGLLYRMFDELPHHEQVAEICGNGLAIGMDTLRCSRGFLAFCERPKERLVMVAEQGMAGVSGDCRVDATAFAPLLDGKLELLDLDGEAQAVWPGMQCERVIAVPVLLQGAPIGLMALLDPPIVQLPNESRTILSLLGRELDTLLDNRAVHAALAESMRQTLIGLVRSLEARDRYTKDHSSRVSQMSLLFAEMLELDPGTVELIRVGGLLHDIGKVGIPDEILLKPGRYTESEYAIMKAHPAIGDSILKHMDTLIRERQVVRHHHERWDGCGYPDGLSGEDIPLAARIVGVADAIDAMTSHRVYRAARPLSFCSEQLRQGAGSQFDAQVVRVALQAIEQGKVRTQADSIGDIFEGLMPISIEEQIGRRGRHLHVQ